LVVTLSIVVTLSGVAAIFYESVVDDQRLSIAANELDEYSKAVRSFMLRNRNPLSVANLEEFDDPFEKGLGGYPLDFLVQDGLYQEIKRDPWGNYYRLDPDAGQVYSLGPDSSEAGDDIRRSYSRRRSNQGSSYQDVLDRDEIPPVISGVQPVGVVKIGNPTVRASFYDHFGGTIDQASVRMFLDQNDMSGDSGLTTDSAGQILFTTSGAFSEKEHTVVVQVADSSGNLARREWTFVVDTVSAIAHVLKPVQGEAVKGIISPKFEAQDDNLSKITVRLDFANKNTSFNGLTPDGDVTGAPPQVYSAAVDRYVGEWANWDTSLPPPVGIEDGYHYMTLLVEDKSGRVISDQSQFLVDNTSPTVDFIVPVDPLAQPPMAPDPQIISTSVIHLEARATDNLQVSKVYYAIYPVGSPGTYVGRRGSELVTGPSLMVPYDWNGVPLGDWGSLFNSVEEIASTTANGVPAYIPVTVPEGSYILKAWAEDLAGNSSFSTAATTEFIVDLSASGLVGLVFREGPTVSTDPIDQATMTISAMLPPYNSWTASSVQTSGHLEYTLLRFEPSSSIRAMIDDMTTIPFDASLHSGGDGHYAQPSPIDFGRGDWESWSANNLPQSTGTKRIDFDYIPYGDDPAGTAWDVRRNDASQMPGGAYEVKVDLDFLISEDKTAYTTFWLDTEYPNYTDPGVLQVEVAGPVFMDVSTLTAVSQLTITSPPAILFGGQISDDLCEASVGCDQEDARITQVFARRYSERDGYTAISPLITDPNDWVQVFPLSGDPIARTASYGNLAIQAGSGPFRLTSSTVAELEGLHWYDLKAVDGAGHTTAWRTQVLVNTIGPVITLVRIENASGGPELLNALNTPTLTPVDDPFLTLRIQATDEVPVERIQYRILPNDGSAGVLGTTVIPFFSSLLSVDTGIFSIYEDQLGSAFKSDGTSYTLEVYGDGAGRPGPVLVTNIEFNYTGSLAIYAPNWTNSGPVVALGQSEQKAIASYLLGNLEQIPEIGIYDETEALVAGSGPAKLRNDSSNSWLEVHTTDSKRDILVALDTFPLKGIGVGSEVENFLQSADENTVVFCGGLHPSLELHQGDGSLDHSAGSATSGDAARDMWRDMFDSGDATLGLPHADEVAPGTNVQVPTAKAKMLLPSLGSYRPEDLWGGALNIFGVLQGPNTGDDSVSGTWTVEERFLRDTLGSNPPNEDVIRNVDGDRGDGHRARNDAQAEGAAFVLQHSNGGRFAVFFSHGEEDMGHDGSHDGGTERLPVAVAGPVIEEFIEQYLTGAADPGKFGGKVAFTAFVNGLKKDRVELPAGGNYPPAVNSEIDAILWPFFDGVEKYSSLSPFTLGATPFDADSTREVVTVLDTDAAGSSYLVLSEGQDVGEVANNANLVGAYLMRPDGSRIPVYLNYTATGSANALWGRLSSDGSAAVILGSADQTNGGSIAHPESQGDPLVWWFDLKASPPTPKLLSWNDPAAAQGAIRADISRNGNSVAFIADTPHEGTNTDPGGTRGLAIKSPVHKLVVTNVSSGKTFWVNKPDSGVSIPPLSHACGGGINFFNHAEPIEVAIGPNGDRVAWIARPAGSAPAGCLGDQPQLLISELVGGNTWSTGKVTDCPVGKDCEIGTGPVSLDMAEVGSDFPWVIFSTKGNFRDLTVGGTFGGDPDQSFGADPSSGVGGGGGGGWGGGGAGNIEDDFEYGPVPVAKDDFDSQDYSGGAGWALPWSEADDDGSDSSGHVQIIDTNLSPDGQGPGAGCKSGYALLLHDASGTASCGGLVCDDFSSGNYGGGHGWYDAAWTEFAEIDDPNAGDVRVVSGHGATSCDDSDHVEFANDWSSWDGITRRVDLTGWANPKIRFDIDNIDLEGFEKSRFSWHDGSSWHLAVWEDTEGTCRSAEANIPFNGVVRIYLGSSHDGDGGWNWDRSHLDNVVLFDTVPPLAAVPSIERSFPALGSEGMVRFTREMWDLDLATQGMAFDYWDGSWHELRKWSAAGTTESACQTEAFPLPAGASKIRFRGAGANLPSSKLWIDDLTIETSDPYSINPGQWVTDWTESGDTAGVATNSPFDGAIRTGGMSGCMGDKNLLFWPTLDSAPNGGQEIERTVNLSGFQYPYLSFSRWFGLSSFTNASAADESFVVEFKGSGGWVPLHTYKNSTITSRGGCVTDRFFLPENVANAKIRFRLVGTGLETGGEGDGADRARIDDIVIHDAAQDCPAGAGICDDLSSNSYSGGIGWAGPWVEGNDGAQDELAGDARVVNGGLAPDCQAGEYLHLADDTYVERSLDPKIRQTLAVPVVEFDMSFACNGVCDEDVRVVAYSKTKWIKVLDLRPTAFLSCKHYVVPLPPDTEKIRFRVNVKGNQEADDIASIDNIFIRNAPEVPSPFVCQGGNICDDWSSNSPSGGQGWNNDWDDNDEWGNTSLRSDAGSPCRDGKQVRFDAGQFDQNDKITRDISMSASASMRYRMGFWLEGAATSSEYLEVKFKTTGADPTLDVYGNIGCNYYEIQAPDGEAPDKVEFKLKGDDLNGGEYFYLDNLVIYDANAPVTTCAIGEICDDFSSQGYGGGVGWNGGWDDDEDGDPNGQRVRIRNSPAASCLDGYALYMRNADGQNVHRWVDRATFDAMSEPTIEFDWVWINADGGPGDRIRFEVKGGGNWSIFSSAYQLVEPQGCNHMTISLNQSSTGLGNPIDFINFYARDNLNNNDIIAIDNIRIYDAATVASPALHPFRGIYLWTGILGGSGNQFFQIADPQDGPAFNPRISPDGRTFVFETDAQRINGLLGWDPGSSDRDARRIPQILDVLNGGAISSNWSGDPRKVIRGRLSGSTNPAMGGSSVLQIIAPLDDVGTLGTPLLPNPSVVGGNPFANLTLPVCSN
jgi:hypothetical protein